MDYEYFGTLWIIKQHSLPSSFSSIRNDADANANSDAADTALTLRRQKPNQRKRQDTNEKF